MVQIVYIKSANEIPADGRYVLVRYGAERKSLRHARGATFIIAQDAPNREPLFDAALDAAKRSAFCAAGEVAGRRPG